MGWSLIHMRRDLVQMSSCQFQKHHHDIEEDQLQPAHTAPTEQWHCCMTVVRLHWAAGKAGKVHSGYPGKHVFA